MNINLLHDKDLTNYGILIACGLILGCSIYYLISSNVNNTTAIPNPNIEGFTNEEIEAIFNENRDITAISNENIDKFITDSDFDTDVESEYQSTFEYDSSSDNESILDEPIADLDLFFMPNVDFDVCPIEELKFFEWTSLYAKEIAEHSVTDEDIMDFIEESTKEELLSNQIDELFLLAVSLM